MFNSEAARADAEMSAAVRFAILNKEKRKLEAELARVKEKLDGVANEVMDFFTETGISSAKTVHGTVYLQRQLWAKPRDGDYERACEVLNQVGLGSYVQKRFNVHSLSAYVREKDAAGEALPKEVQDAIEVSEVFKIASRAKN